MFRKLAKLGGLVKKLKPIAPMAARALEFAPWPGPVAKAALQKVADAVGGDPAEPASVEASLDQATLADLVALREKDAELKAALKKAQIDLTKARIADVQDARQAHRGSRFMPVLACAIMAAFCGAAGGVLWAALGLEGDIDSTANSLIFAILGYLSAMAQQVSSYYFGSSQSDAEGRSREMEG